MSIDGISSSANWWQWQSQAAQSTTGSNAASAAPANPASGTVTNPGSPTVTASLASFVQAFSADLQAMLTQSASESAAPPAPATTTTDPAATQPASQTASTNTQGAVHHHHHHGHGGVGQGGSMQSAANRLVNEIGQSQAGGTLSPAESASAFATDVMQALQSYGTTATSGSNGSILA